MGEDIFELKRRRYLRSIIRKIKCFSTFVQKEQTIENVNLKMLFILDNIDIEQSPTKATNIVISHYLKF